MALPQQVQDQVDEAERLQAELAVEQPAPEPPAPAEVPAPEPVAPAPETPVAPAPAAESEATWQQRYQTLQGMFKAEVPRLRTEVQELKDALTVATTKLTQLAQQPPQEPKAPEAKAGAKDAEEFGSDLVEMVRRQAVDAARAEFQGEISSLKALNKDLEDKLASVSDRQGNTARSTYFADLAKVVPDYEQVNEDPLFLAWLNEEDVLSGEKRQEYLNRAFGAMDVQRTAKLFGAFKDSLKTEPVIVPPTPVVETPVVTELTPAQRLERQVAPRTSAASAPIPPDNGQKIWSMSEIEGFYRDVTKGEFKDKPQEQARIEADIDRAVAEGRLK